MKFKKCLQPLNNEKGMVLMLTIVILSVLVLLGSTAVMTTTTDLRISRNYKTSEQAFYAAEAGLEEVRVRLAEGFTPATGATGRIVDTAPTSAAWSASIGGTGSYTSIQSALTYVVPIVHQTSGGSVLYYGDPSGFGNYTRSTTPGEKMRNIYLVTSTGSFAGAQKTITAEMTKLPPIAAPAALYVQASTTIQGTSTNIIGVDQCGGSSMPGVVTTLGAGTVSATGHPKVCGVNDPCTNTSPWDVVGNGAVIDVSAMVAQWKGSANYRYSVNSQTQTGMNWGTPVLGATLQNPSSCSASNIVYYNTNSTYVKLAGGTMGCGIMLVDGNMEVNGGFDWYGLVIVSGSIIYTGGGNKNITGAVLSGGHVDADLVGGNANIVYCSTAVNNQTANRPLRMLSWKESM